MERDTWNYGPRERRPGRARALVLAVVAVGVLVAALPAQAEGGTLTPSLSGKVLTVAGTVDSDRVPVELTVRVTITAQQDLSSKTPTVETLVIDGVPDANGAFSFTVTMPGNWHNGWYRVGGVAIFYDEFGAPQTSFSLPNTIYHT